MINKIIKKVKCGDLTPIFVLFLGVFFLPAFANPDTVSYQSAIVWSVDGQGDYSLDPESFPETGIYELNSSYSSDGQIETITATWEFEGQVRLEVSADGGNNYIPVTYGTPVSSQTSPNFVSGDSLRWRAIFSKDSTLYKVKITYTDSSGVAGSFGQPELSGFNYRKPIEIVNPLSRPLYNYQLQIKIAQGSSLEEADIYCQGNSQVDFKDIRFTSADGQTPLSYYQEAVSGEAPNRVATFWVKLPYIPAEGLSLYLYYGNSQAKDLSNPEAVFDFYETFSGKKLNQDKWQLYTQLTGEYEVADSQLKLSGAKIISKNYQLKDGILEVKAAPEDEVRVIVREDKENPNSTQVGYSSNIDDAQHCIAIGNIVKANNPIAISPAASYNYKVVAKESSLTFYRGQESVSYQDETGIKEGYIGLETGDSDGSYYDWIRVRKYAEEKPYLDNQQESEQEKVSLPIFNSLKITADGDLISEEDKEGSYSSVLFDLPYQVRVVVPYLETVSNTEGEEPAVEFDISVDGGDSYITDSKNDTYYYASQGDFSPGNNLKFELKLKEEKVKRVSIDYRQGKILIISPNGDESWPAGQTKEILWSALGHQDSYPVKIEYSLDNGATFKTIAKEVKNSGSFVWDIPEDMSSGQAKIKVSDYYDSSVYGLSSDTFTIGQEQIETEEAKEIVEKEVRVSQQDELAELTAQEAKIGDDLREDIVIDANVIIRARKDLKFNSLTIGDGTGQNKSTLILYGDIDSESGDILIRKGGELIQANSKKQSIQGGLTVNSGGKITHLANSDSSQKVYQINLEAENISLDSGGVVTASAKGYSGGGIRKAGKGKSGGKFKDMFATGGSHGGLGGGIKDYNLSGQAYGEPKEPDELGSGGAGSWFVSGGSGAGVVKLTSRNNFLINGIISADGADGKNSLGNEYDSGGGAGGSIYLEAENFSGAGAKITATGGSGQLTGGGGAGGRIHIKALSGNINGTLNANGGPGAKKGFGGSVIVE